MTEERSTNLIDDDIVPQINAMLRGPLDWKWDGCWTHRLDGWAECISQIPATVHTGDCLFAVNDLVRDIKFRPELADWMGGGDWATVVFGLLNDARDEIRKLRNDQLAASGKSPHVICKRCWGHGHRNIGPPLRWEECEVCRGIGEVLADD